MQKLKNSVRLCLIYTAVVLLAGGQPMIAMAETVETPPSISQGTTPETVPVTEEERTYTYNPDTNRWDSDKWTYNPKTGKYEAVLVPLVAAEQQPVVVPPATNAPTASSTVTSNTNAVIDNKLQSNAKTGDAAVNKNTTGGSATTGNATAIANLMNTVNSSVSGGGAQFATFVTDVVGDVHGDIMLYPMLLAAMLQAASTPTDSTITVNNDATIKNDLNLNANSGNAAVTNNTTAGNATTGTAHTVANVMNIINSIIAANQSFVGTVNIYGNLDGDILVAPDFLPQLLANNTGGSSAPANSLLVSADDTQSIINNIDLRAATGNAVVSNNTNAGSAVTGDAKTNLVLLNLSGHQIVAKDSLLVFVNVLGQWVGLIVDAPAGTNAAALGTGVTSNGVAPDLTIRVDNSSQIVNDINLNSQSGDATVANNTNAGNATTGDATASANIANISGSQLGLSGWFGVLFINVFGNWFGSFGVDTARGNSVTPGRGGVDSSNPAPKLASQPFQFIPHDNSTRSTSVSSLGGLITGQSATPKEVVTEGSPDDSEEIALTAYTPSSGATNAKVPVNQAAAPGNSQIDFLPLIGSALILGLGAVLAKLAIAVIRGRGLVA